ncbi:Hypothetical_protein [Hexamita inflata]|uniref:Hypothetical_protein n=1 Tax=Hexamita inflata TaxID=28002 RepID=A0AA86UIT2_9EUKA|nr:Hypothetical protein HINF_LOCUS10890 [Hexamita inflata]CAI9953171.1 Hypothetical protein HINF_LOCUS40816 [Hexamita inflata]
MNIPQPLSQIVNKHIDSSSTDKNVSSFFRKDEQSVSLNNYDELAFKIKTQIIQIRSQLKITEELKMKTKMIFKRIKDLFQKQVETCASSQFKFVVVKDLR